MIFAVQLLILYIFLKNSIQTAEERSEIETALFRVLKTPSYRKSKQAVLLEILGTEPNLVLFLSTFTVFECGIAVFSAKRFLPRRLTKEQCFIYFLSYFSYNFSLNAFTFGLMYCTVTAKTLR